jgi:hypothetical protein
MSVRIQSTAAALLIALGLMHPPAFAQGAQDQSLTAEEQIAAQNFNDIDIVSDSLGTSQNSGISLGMPTGQNFNQGMNCNRNVLNNSMMHNGLSSQLNSQNTQLGQASMFNNNSNSNNATNGNGYMPNNGMNNGMNGCMNNNAMNNGINNCMPNNAMNSCTNGGMVQNGFSNEMSGNMNNNGGGIVQTIGNCIMNDPKMMQRAVGVAGAAALLGVFVSNGGIGGMMRSAGMDNTRHIRGPGGGY